MLGPAGPKSTRRGQDFRCLRAPDASVASVTNSELSASANASGYPASLSDHLKRFPRCAFLYRLRRRERANVSTRWNAALCTPLRRLAAFSAGMWSSPPGGNRFTRSATIESTSSSISLQLNQSPNMGTPLVAAFTPCAPHRPIGVFEVAHESCLVHDRRSPHCLAQRTAQFRKQRLFTREFGGQSHVVLARGRNPAGESYGGENAGGASRYRAGALQSDHRYPHPQGIAGRRSAAVRSRVQRDIHAADRVEVVVERRVGQCGDSLGRYPGALQIGEHSVPGRSVGNTGEQQPGIRHALENIGPEPADARRELRDVVERAERDKTVLLRRELPRRDVLDERAVAPLTVGKPQQGLGVKCIGEPLGIGMGVANPIVDASQAGRVQVSEPGCLYRSRLLGENAETKNAGMPREIHQDVNPVLVDRVGELVVGHRLRVAKDIRPFLDRLRDLVRGRTGRVAEDLVRVSLDHREREQGDRMPPEIAREVADAQTPLRVFDVPELKPWRDCFLEALAERLVPGEERVAGKLLRAGERKQLRGLQVELFRSEFSGGREAFESLSYFRLAAEHASQCFVRGQEAGIDLDRASQGGFRFGKSLRLPQDDPVVVQRPDVVRALLERGPQRRRRGFGVSPQIEDIGQGKVGLRELGSGAQCEANQLFGAPGVATLEKQVAEVVVRVGVRGLDREGRFEGLDRAAGIARGFEPDAEIEMSSGVAWRRGDGLAVPLARLPQPSRILRPIALGDQRVGEGVRAGHVPQRRYFSTDLSSLPISAGFFVVLIPHSSITASFSCAVPFPPEMMAPAWPMRFPGGAVTPAMKPITGFFMLA